MTSGRNEKAKEKEGKWKIYIYLGRIDDIGLDSLDASVWELECEWGKETEWRNERRRRRGAPTSWEEISKIRGKGFSLVRRGGKCFKSGFTPVIWSTGVN